MTKPLTEELKACPCGKIPAKLGITEQLSGKWGETFGDCCNQWIVEFRNNYDTGGELYKNAVKAWNEAPRQQTERNQVIDECVEAVEAIKMGKQYYASDRKAVWNEAISSAINALKDKSITD